jgi:hypothetical protein
VGTMESAAQHCQRADMRGRLTEQHGTTVQPKRMKRSTDMPMQRWVGALGCDGVWSCKRSQVFLAFGGV